MRTMTTGLLVAATAFVTCGAAHAQFVPPFKGNDTGGIIAYRLANEMDIKALAVDHCARYDKAVKLTGVQAYDGGYLSFACIWTPPASARKPLRVRY
jgi:hypothetical protein